MKDRKKTCYNCKHYVRASVTPCRVHSNAELLTVHQGKCEKHEFRK